MKYSESLYVVINRETTKKFYHEILGLHVVLDFGANFTMTGAFLFKPKKVKFSFFKYW